MDERFTPRPVARWFIVAAIVSLLFGLLICFGYFVHLTTDPTSLALDGAAIISTAASGSSAAPVCRAL